MKLINIGFGNLVSADKIVAMVQDAKEQGTCVDATYGRKTKAVIITDCDLIVLSAKTAESFENKGSKGERTVE